MNIDCQIRGKCDINEALSTMCEVEYMEGDNKVYCENCKKNCDTILRTAISALPDMLILSLKRFDLDYNTFETVKLNSRCEFGQTLNMKRYTLEGVEAMEKASDENDESFDPLSQLPDEDYEYRLAGVLVHHGVAQGGHYYSFIRDRSDNGQDKNEWHRFDDEDVTPFDPSNIETECFGGKVKKETKWPNGQVNTVETEQLANALMLFYEKVKPVKLSNQTDPDMDMEESQNVVPGSLQMVTGSDDFQADVKKSNTVHRSHSFLFGKEFQMFMKSMLNMFVVELSSGLDETMANESPNFSITTSQIHLDILNVCLTFFFDVLLHSVEKEVLFEWTKLLCKALRLSTDGSTSFVKNLSKRSKQIAGNWLRTFSTDCPEMHCREAAMEVFAVGIESFLSIGEETNELKSWTLAWQKQVDAWNPSGSNAPVPIPLCLIGDAKIYEDIGVAGNNKASSLGAIISFLCVLLDIAPRTWRYTPELCLLLRRLASIPSQLGGEMIRNALLASQIPARLICTVLREKSHPLLRSAFPGSSLSADIVEQTTKPEFTPSSHLLPLGSTSVGVGSNLNSSGPCSGAPSPADHSKAIEALAAIIGIVGMNFVPLVSETGRYSKNRPLVDLTPAAKHILSGLFTESSSQPGVMSQKDVSCYVKFCNAGEIPQQRIANMLNKYGKDSNCLTLEGFLAHYRDASQSSEHEVRNLDLYCSCYTQ
jgi:ubiquitin carboxyl-terminal hydrolase 9/24